jgi:hypothetical protein
MELSRAEDSVPHGVETPPPHPSHTPPSLFRELADGTAGPFVKAFVSLAAAPLLAGFGLLLSYVLAAYVQDWNRSYGYARINPREEMVACVLGFCALLYVAALAWIWTRDRRRHRTFWAAALLTIGVVIATILAGVLIDSAIRGGEEIVIAGVVFLALAGIVFIWIEAGRRHTRPQPILNPSDGALDVRCPSCDYRMVGLHESRCPECGTAYTLDELLGRQAFLTKTHRRDGTR